MPPFLGDLPLHPLVVHAVVVLVPLTVLGAIVVAVWPAARRRYGTLVVACGAVALVCTIVAEQTGEGLERYLPHSEAIETHEHLADTLKLWVAALLVLVAAFVLVSRRAERAARREGPGTTAAPARPAGVRVVTLALAALTVLAAVGTGVQVYRVGDSGAQAVWGGRTWQVQPGSRERG